MSPQESKSAARRASSRRAGVAGRRRPAAQLLLAQRMERLRRRTAAAAHDLNNLLTGIGGFAELALRALPADHVVRADLEEIVRASEQAALLTLQLRALAYPRSAAPRALALNDLIAALEEQLRRILGDAIMLRWLPAANLCAIRADPAQIAQILINLVLNAREAMPDGGLLTLATANVTRGADAAGGSQPGDGVLLTITDTGAGMEAEVQAQLFEPFVTTKSARAAHGMELFAVSELVQHCGGSVAVASAPGVGTTVSLYLPRAPAPAALANPHERARGAAARIEAQLVVFRRIGGEQRAPVGDVEGVRDLLQRSLVRPHRLVMPQAEHGAVCQAGILRQRPDRVALRLGELSDAELHRAPRLQRIRLIIEVGR